MSTMESFKSEPQFSPFSPRKPSLFLFFARSCSITLYRTQPIKIELLSYYLTIMVRYRNLVRQIGPSESTELLIGIMRVLLYCTHYTRVSLCLFFFQEAKKSMLLKRASVQKRPANGPDHVVQDIWAKSSGEKCSVCH